MKYLYYGVVIVVLAFALMGCTTTGKVEYIEVPVEVKVPIAIKCKVSYPEPPKINIGRMAIPSEVDDMGLLLIRENEEHRRYAKELITILGQCAEQP